MSAGTATAPYRLRFNANYHKQRMWPSIYWVLAKLVILTTKLVSAQTIPDRLNVRSLFAPDAVAQLQQCNADLKTQAFEAHIEKIRQNDVNASSGGAFGRVGPGSAAVFIGDAWTCIEFSPNGYALLPPDALKNTVSTIGASPSGLIKWRRELLAELGKNGTVKGLIVMANGSATSVTYHLAKYSLTSINYEARSLNVGEFNVGDYSIVLAESGISSTLVATWGVSQVQRKPIVHRQLIRLPTLDGFVAVEGTSKTSQDDFVGSVWKSEELGYPTQPELRLKRNGIADLQISKLSYTGKWEVVNDTLRVNLESWFKYSLVLSKNGRFLQGQGRRVDAMMPILSEMAGRRESDDVDREVRVHGVLFYKEGDLEHEKSITNRREQAREKIRERRREAVAEIEKRRIAILGESVAIEKEEQQKADVRVGKPESAWRLCDSDLAMTITETTERIGSELVQTNVGPLCYSWTGTRKNWKEIILRDGCKGRCNPV